MAVATPRPPAATTVGRPRRSRAPSRTSSWTSVAEWISSTATAARTSPAQAAGASPATMNTSRGRRRLPPAAIVSPPCRASTSPCPPASTASRCSSSSMSGGTCDPAAWTRLSTFAATAI